MEQISRNESISIGTTAVEISPKRKREMIYICNTSSAGQVVYVMFSEAEKASAGKGFVLQPTSTLLDCNSEGYLCWQGTITAIASGANGSVSVVER